MEEALLSFVLSGLGRNALRGVALLALAVLLGLGFAVSSIAALFSLVISPAPVAWLPSPGLHLGEIPAEQLPVMQAAAASCGLPWQILAGIARVESDFGANMSTSSAGAIGYGQFLPSTWAEYGQGGNPYDYHDALPAMARYLCANGAPQDLRRAIFAYNHADWYVHLVLEVAVHYGFALPGGPQAQGGPVRVTLIPGSMFSLARSLSGHWRPGTGDEREAMG